MQRTVKYNLGIFCACLVLFFGVYLVMGVEPVQATPIVMEATLASPNGILKDVSFNAPHASPWSVADTTLTTIGSADTEYNNMGWRAKDGYIYGIQLTPFGNTGSLVKIDPGTGGVVNTTSIPGLPTNVRFDAGDVNNNADVLYISSTKGTNSTLYVLNLSTLALSTVPMTGDTGYVADWAYNPTTGNLYGIDTQGQFATLNPTTGVRSDSKVIFPTVVGYGSAWYNPSDGDIYVYRNLPAMNGACIFQVDPATTTIVNKWGAKTTLIHDGAFVAVPIPPSVWLFASGLLGLGLLDWRRKRA
jgi:hypothetical protein